jgi:hypothetical protein
VAKSKDPSSVEIIPLKGLNILSFGSEMAQALRVLGEPEEKEKLKDDILNSDSEVFHYWKIGLSLFFNNQSGLKLTCIEIDSRDTFLWGEKLFLLSEIEIKELFKKNGFEVSETENHEWGEMRISFDEALMDLYFENGQLTSVNFGYFQDDHSYYFFPN